MSLSAKESLQKLVRDALREPYDANQISKNQFIDINRNVSRMLYDRVGADSVWDDESAKAWKQVARNEVAKAIASL